MIGRVIAVVLAGLTFATPVLAASSAPFDAPMRVDVVKLPADPLNPSAEPKISCSRYPKFTVKQVDLGEVGAEKLALMPADAPCTRDDAGERVVSDDLAGYFLGAAGPYVFFQAADGWNNGLPFVVFDQRDGKRLFDDSFAPESLTAVHVEADRLTLRFDRVFTTSCSLLTDRQDCIKRITAETGLTDDQIPDCTAAYEAEIERTPDYAAEIRTLPSVIEYPVELVWSNGEAKPMRRDGKTACYLPS